MTTHELEPSLKKQKKTSPLSIPKSNIQTQTQTPAHPEPESESLSTQGSSDAVPSSNTTQTPNPTIETIQDQQPILVDDDGNIILENLDVSLSLFNSDANEIYNCFVVEFKSACVYYKCLSTIHILPGFFVIVEADRGIDLGIVASQVPYDSKLHSSLKQIIRVALQSEIILLPEKSEAEISALMFATKLARDSHLSMHVIDAEFQFDSKKLTIFFTSDRRIDFRHLVKHLFLKYKSRIWMRRIKETNIFNLKQIIQYSNRITNIHPNTPNSELNPLQSHRRKLDNVGKHNNKGNIREKIKKNSQTSTRSKSQSQSKIKTRITNGFVTDNGNRVDNKSKANMITKGKIRPMHQPQPPPNGNPTPNANSVESPIVKPTNRVLNKAPKSKNSHPDFAPPKNISGNYILGRANFVIN